MAGKYQGEFVMNSICIIDTSIFLNILDVPSRNNDKERVIRDFEEYIQSEQVSFFYLWLLFWKQEIILLKMEMVMCGEKRHRDFVIMFVKL